MWKPRKRELASAKLPKCIYMSAAQLLELCIPLENCAFLDQHENIPHHLVVLSPTGNRLLGLSSTSPRWRSLLTD